jgi:hypothetical protein
MNKLSQTTIETMWIHELDKLAVEIRKDLDKHYNFSSSNYNATDIDDYKPLPPP